MFVFQITQREPFPQLKMTSFVRQLRVASNELIEAHRQLISEQNRSPTWAKQAARCGIDRLFELLIICFVGTFESSAFHQRFSTCAQVIEMNHSIYTHDFVRESIWPIDKIAVLYHVKWGSVYSDITNMSVSQQMRLLGQITDRMNDVDDQEPMKRKRMSTDELAKREAYLWEMDVAALAETTQDGIKTRNSFHKRPKHN